VAIEKRRPGHTDEDRSVNLPREIGLWGTAARVGIGLWLVGSVAYGHLTRGWHSTAWLLGLVVFPAILTGWRWQTARRHVRPMRANGPIAHVVAVGIFLILYFSWWYAPALDVASDAGLLFYGASMLAAALRGQAGCEVFAFSNWLLRRDDQIGCALFWPLDTIDARHRTPER
jgi:hypothetical protein